MTLIPFISLSFFFSFLSSKNSQTHRSPAYSLSIGSQVRSSWNQVKAQVKGAVHAPSLLSPSVYWQFWIELTFYLYFNLTALLAQNVEKRIVFCCFLIRHGNESQILNDAANVFRQPLTCWSATELFAFYEREWKKFLKNVLFVSWLSCDEISITISNDNFLTNISIFWSLIFPSAYHSTLSLIILPHRNMFYSLLVFTSVSHFVQQDWETLAVFRRSVFKGCVIENE